MTYIIEPADDLSNRFDPRLGGTGNWLGSDCAASIQLDATRVLWLWNDTWKKNPSFPNYLVDKRQHAFFVNNSLTVQTGLDLATATLDFYFGASNGNMFDVPGGTHYAWPEGAIILDGDLYVMSKRTAIADWQANSGFCLHKIPAVASTDPSLWAASVVFLYQSGNTDCRPNLSLQDGAPTDVDEGVNYVYGHALKAQDGWRRGRLPRSEFKTGNFTNLKWSQFLTWTSDPTQAVEMADSFISADGSLHKRASDGRWFLVEMGGEYPQGFLQIRNVARSGDGNYYPADNYYPWPPFQLHDRAIVTATAKGGNITNITDRGVYTLLLDFGEGTWTGTTAELTQQTGTARRDYTPPEHAVTPTCFTYAGKAHPELTSTQTGLICTYVDLEGDRTGPDSSLASYYPKFVRIKPPKIHSLTLENGKLNWSLSGAPDRVYYQINSGSWVEITDPLPTTSSVTLPTLTPVTTVSLKAVGVGGEVTATTSVTALSLKTKAKTGGAVTLLH